MQCIKPQKRNSCKIKRRFNIASKTSRRVYPSKGEKEKTRKRKVCGCLTNSFALERFSREFYPESLRMCIPFSILFFMVQNILFTKILKRFGEWISLVFNRVKIIILLIESPTNDFTLVILEVKKCYLVNFF